MGKSGAILLLGGVHFSHPLSGKDAVLDYFAFLAVNLETSQPGLSGCHTAACQGHSESHW